MRVHSVLGGKNSRERFGPKCRCDKYKRWALSISLYGRASVSVGGGKIRSLFFAFFLFLWLDNARESRRRWRAQLDGIGQTLAHLSCGGVFEFEVA